jgi:CoA:oxalate CoA-transferase
LQGIEMPFLACLLNMPELAEAPRFQSPDARRQNMKELEAIIAAKLAVMDKGDIFRQAGEWRQFCGYVTTPEDLLADPQYRARGFWTEIDHPHTGKQTYPGAPVKMIESCWQTERAPLPGEQNESILCSLLGYSKEELFELNAKGII